VKEQVREVISPWARAEKGVFDDEVDQKQGAVIEVVVGSEQAPPERNRYIRQILIERFILYDEKLIVQLGESQLEHPAIDKNSENSEDKKGIFKVKRARNGSLEFAFH